MDDETPKHRKKKPSDKSNAKARSDHKHKYEPCILHIIVAYTWGERCAICGRMRHRWFPSKDRELRRPLGYSKAAVGANDFLTVREMKEKFPGVRVY